MEPGSTPLILALKRQKPADLCEFKASVLYRLSSRTDKATQRNLSQKTKQNNNKTSHR